MRGWYARQTPEKKREMYLAQNRERKRETARARYAMNRVAISARNVEWARADRAANPEKWKARNAVNNAIRLGKLERQPCEVCGAPKVQAHHEDYAKPLDVRWLCRTHHWQEHSPVSMQL
jgi:ribosomal protein S27AE